MSLGSSFGDLPQAGGRRRGRLTALDKASILCAKVLEFGRSFHTDARARR